MGIKIVASYPINVNNILINVFFLIWKSLMLLNDSGTFKKLQGKFYNTIFRIKCC